MAIATGTAILGAALVGGAASYLSSKNAAGKAKDAANYAADQNAAVNREIYTQTRADLAPYNQAGQGGLAALMTRLGLSPVTPGSAPQQPTTNPGAYGVGAGQPPAAKTVGGPAGTSPLASPVRSAGPTGPATMSATDAQNYASIGMPINLATRPDAQPASPAPGGGAYSGNAGQGNMSDPSYFSPGGPAPTAAASPQAAPATAGQPNWDAYDDQFGGDVQNEYARLQGSPEGQARLAQLGIGSPEQFAQYHYETFGKQEGRQVPTTGGPADPNAPAPQYFQETYDQRPDALPVQAYERGPDLAAPDMASFFDNFEADPGYQFRLSEGLKGVNAASAARGKLRSGDAAMALQARGEGLAAQGYGDWWNRQKSLYDASRQDYQYGQNRQDTNFLDDRSYGTNLTLQQQGRNDNIFSEDRGFAAGRNDQATSNLFGLAGIGQNAAAGTANAGNVFASNSIANNNNRANTTANAAIANAANMSNLFGSAAGAAATYYGARRV